MINSYVFTTLKLNQFNLTIIDPSSKTSLTHHRYSLGASQALASNMMEDSKSLPQTWIRYQAVQVTVKCSIICHVLIIFMLFIHMYIHAY